jgi:hypothetical protein
VQPPCKLVKNPLCTFAEPVLQIEDPYEYRLIWYAIFQALQVCIAQHCITKYAPWLFC